MNEFYSCVFIFLNLLVVRSAVCGPIPFKDIPSADTFDFMRRYGYIENGDGDSEALFTEEGLESVVKQMQMFGAIPQTGKLDNETLALMRKPRCGVRDIIKTRRRKRFALGSSGWNKRNITFFIANWSGKLSEETVAKYITLGLDTWGRYGRLNFKRVYNTGADIIVAFGSGYHGDRYPFDGPGNILAHAFFPYEMESFGGDIHFDDDEQWIIDEDIDDGVNFFQVAVHELGHSLGLSHSPIRNSVMFPYYNGNSPTNLDYDDILGMYELYIKRNLPEGDDNEITLNPTSSYEDNTEETHSEAETDEDFDRDSFTSTTVSTTMDALITSRWYPYNTTTHQDPNFETTTHETRTVPYTTPLRKSPHTTILYATDTYNSDHSTQTLPYSGSSTASIPYHETTTPRFHYYNDSESVDDHKTHDPMHSLPTTNSPSLPDVCQGHYDAVATLRNELFFFKDQYVWRLRNEHELIPGYPVPIRQMFPELPKSVTKIDAVYQRPDGRIVFFVGRYFWVFDGTYFIEDSPKDLSHYGLPGYLDKIDAIQNWGRNRKTYIYKDDHFWRYNEDSKKMDPDYPQHIERWRGVPANLDAASTWKGITYFFKGHCHWTFDNEWIITTENSPSPTPQTWFGCPKEEVEYCEPRNLTP